MSLELKLTFSLDRSGKPEETVVKYRLPPDATGVQISDILSKTHGFVIDVIFKTFDFKGEEYGS